MADLKDASHPCTNTAGMFSSEGIVRLTYFYSIALLRDSIGISRINEIKSSEHSGKQVTSTAVTLQFSGSTHEAKAKPTQAKSFKVNSQIGSIIKSSKKLDD